MQETLTATVRLRANRQVAADSESFRRHVKQLLGVSEQEARQAGYGSEEVRLALYAVVAFLDESVLNSAQPMFGDWARKPLQDELFGGHMGGELFFQNLQQLLAQQDSEDLADVLEVYQLCVLLGFHGRYSAAAGGELRVLAARVGEKIERIRGMDEALAPDWRLPAGESGTIARDPWVRRLGVAAVVAIVLVVVAFVLFHLSLQSGVAELQAMAVSTPR